MKGKRRMAIFPLAGQVFRGGPSSPPGSGRSFPGTLRTAAMAGVLTVLGGVAWAADPIAAGSGVASGASELLARLPPGVTFAITTLGFGGIAGWSVGYTLKKFAKMVALLIGTVMIVLQMLAYRQYLTIHWEKIESAVPPEGLQSAWVSLMSVVTYNFPFAGAFAVGFYLGFSKG